GPRRHPVGRGDAGGARIRLVPVGRGGRERRPRDHGDVQADLEAHFRRSAEAVSRTQAPRGGPPPPPPPPPGGRSAPPNPPGPPPPGEGEAAATTTSPTLILVTPPKAPGETSPEAASPGKSSQDARKGKPAVEPAGKAGADRIAAMEARLAAVESALAVESEERRRISTRLDELVSAANNRIAAGEADRKAAAPAVEGSLASLSARAEKLFQEVAALSRSIEALEATLREKTAQGLRAAEDIRSQIAPL